MKKFLYLSLCLALFASCGGSNSTEESSNENIENLPEQTQEAIKNVQSLTPDVGSIVSSIVNADGSTTCTDTKGNTINIDISGNTTIISSTGDTTVVDNTIVESKTAEADERSNSTWVGEVYFDAGATNSEQTDGLSFLRYLKEQGANFVETDEIKTVDNSYDTHTGVAVLKFNTTTCSITISDSLSHHDILIQETYKKTVVPEQVIDIYEGHALHIKPSETEIKIYDRIYNRDDFGKVNKSSYKDFPRDSIPLPESGYFLVFQNSNILRYETTLKSTHKKTEYFNITRVSNTVIGIKNATKQYRLAESSMDGAPYFDVYEWGGTTQLYRLYYQLQ